MPLSCGYGGNANVCGGPDGGPGSFRLEIEAGTQTGMTARTWGGIMNSAGDSVCWSDVGMAGANQAVVRYSNGEPAGDSVTVTFNGVTVGTVLFATCDDAWAGDCATASGTLTVPDAGSLTGTLCLVGVGSGWIAALNWLDISGG